MLDRLPSIGALLLPWLMLTRPGAIPIDSGVPPSASGSGGTETASETAAASAARTVSYRIDPDHSRVMFEMKATLHTVAGKTSAVAGTITRPAAPSTEGFTVGGRVAIAARTLETGNGSRDRRMRSESLAVDRFPEIVFVPSRAIGSVTSFA